MDKKNCFTKPSADSHAKFKFLMIKHVNRHTQNPYHEFIYCLFSYMTMCWHIPYHVICWKLMHCVQLAHIMQMVNTEYSMLFR